MTAIIFLIVALISIILAGFLIKKEPRRIINGIFIQLGIIFGYLAILASSLNNPQAFFITQIVTIGLYVIVLLLGILLIIDFLLVVKKEGLSLANILPLGLGILSIVVVIVGYFDLTSGLSGSELHVKIMSVAQKIVLYMPLAFGTILIYSIIYQILPLRKNVKYIIVLGCGLRKNGEVTPLLKGRLNRALKEYQRVREDAIFITSGGQGADEVISEAQAMKNYLLSQGVPEEKIIMEDQSVNTRQNLTFSKEKIDQDGNKGNAVICTSNYHVLRAVLIARSLGFPAQGIGGHTALYYLPVAFIREYIAVIFQHKLLVIIYMVTAVVTGILF